MRVSTGIISHVITLVSIYVTSHDEHLAPQSLTSSVVYQIPFAQLPVYHGSDLILLEKGRFLVIPGPEQYAIQNAF